MTPDDDVRAALARAADGLLPPDGPVDRVRATASRRRRRRTSVRLSAVATAALVAAVLLVPEPDGGTVLPSGDGATSPSDGSGEQGPDGTDAGTLLTPEGLPGLQLGARPDVQDADLRSSGSGCEGVQTREVSLAAVGPAGADATEVIGWLRDGVLVAVLVAVYPDRVEVPGDVPRTWLGPTLRSPLAAALELPGARLVEDDPLGDDGPGVSNVVVPAGEGTELVLSDVPVADRPADGRVTTLVLRTEAGRGCGLVPGVSTVLPGQGLPDQQGDVELTAEGTADVRLGSSVAQALAAGALSPEPADPDGLADPGLADPLDGRGCASYRETATGLQVWADGDTVVAVGEDGLGGPRFVLRAEADVRSGQPLRDLEAEPAVPVRPPPLAGGTGTAVDVAAGPGVRARVVGFETTVVADTTGVLLPGPVLVDGVVLYRGDGPADSLCTS